jgi:hypothetical protein
LWFLKRNKDVVRTKRCKVQDCKRHTWCTYSNFSQMYDDVYDRMVEAGVAIKLDEEAMLNKEGNIVTNKEEMFGRPSKYIVTKLEQILFVDETGSNTKKVVMLVDSNTCFLMVGQVKVV